MRKILVCVTGMVCDLGWETLESRRQKDRLTTLYKFCRHGKVDMDTHWCFNHLTNDHTLEEVNEALIKHNIVGMPLESDPYFHSVK